jgi:hypothetical protein
MGQVAFTGVIIFPKTVSCVARRIWSFVGADDDVSDEETFVVRAPTGTVYNIENILLLFVCRASLEISVFRYLDNKRGKISAIGDAGAGAGAGAICGEDETVGPAIIPRE